MRTIAQTLAAAVCSLALGQVALAQTTPPMDPAAGSPPAAQPVTPPAPEKNGLGADIKKDKEKLAQDRKELKETRDKVHADRKKLREDRRERHERMKERREHK